MKKIILVIIYLIVIFNDLSYSDKSDLVIGELIIYNYAPNTTLKVKVYPIGFVYNGDKEYNPECILNGNYDYIIGGEEEGIATYSSFSLDHDGAGDDGGEASIGYGKYRVVFFQLDSGIYDSIDYCDVDYGDSNYPYGNPFTADINFYYYSSQNIKVWTTSNSLPANRLVTIWDQRAMDSTHVRIPNKYGFSSNDNYINYPINILQYGAVSHLNPGDIDLNLQIDHDINTRDTLIDSVTNITVKRKVALKINSGKTFDMVTPTFGYNNLIVEDTAYLVLYNSAKINVFSPNRITLKNKSNLTLGGNSEIRIKNGAAFCNEGCRIYGHGKIIFEKGIHEFCSYVNDFAVRDSAKIILEDSAVVILPDDYTLRLRGNTTSLIMKPGSKMMFGENSGIVCDSGAKVIANNAVFTSADSTKIWNGISLKHRSQDTIKSCIIKNADFGVNIMNKNDDEETEIPYSTEISGCSFINQTSHVLNNAIYAAGSSKLLISNNV
ncbi:MAG TPA: hypothetical protein PL089_00800 [Ignavibacteria bacterium]|nr:hypothetical protein [Ignavibacteria bacterium]